MACIPRATKSSVDSEIKSKEVKTQLLKCDAQHSAGLRAAGEDCVQIRCRDSLKPLFGNRGAPHCATGRARSYHPPSRFGVATYFFYKINKRRLTRSIFITKSCRYFWFLILGVLGVHGECVFSIPVRQRGGDGPTAGGHPDCSGEEKSMPQFIRIINWRVVIMIHVL